MLAVKAAWNRLNSPRCLDWPKDTLSTTGTQARGLQLKAGYYQTGVLRKGIVSERLTQRYVCKTTPGTLVPHRDRLPLRNVSMTGRHVLGSLLSIVHPLRNPRVFPARRLRTLEFMGRITCTRLPSSVLVNAPRPFPLKYMQRQSRYRRQYKTPQSTADYEKQSRFPMRMEETR
jgi:hypothetical protein